MFDFMGIKVIGKEVEYSNVIKEFEKFTTLPVVVDNSVKGTAMANIDFQNVITSYSIHYTKLYDKNYFHLL